MGDKSEIHFTYDGCGWLVCFANDPDAESGILVTTVEPGKSWDEMAAEVAAHLAEHGCGAAAVTPC